MNGLPGSSNASTLIHQYSINHHSLLEPLMNVPLPRTQFTLSPRFPFLQNSRSAPFSSFRLKSIHILDKSIHIGFVGLHIW
jgi:hypothetical protein